MLYIQQQRKQFTRQGQPVISVDTKKKELIGGFKNPGAKWDRQPVPVNDHDFRSQADDLLIPYGVYDPQANRAARCASALATTPLPPLEEVLAGQALEPLRPHRHRQSDFQLLDSQFMKICVGC